jgi:serine-threonine kinase receptor-associated protein
MAAILGVDQIVSRGHTRPLTEISFVEDGSASKTLLVSSAHDKQPTIRSGETGDWIGCFQGHKGAVWSCKVDAATRTLCATASGDFSAKLWCATTGKELYEFKHKHVVKTVEFSHDTLQIATGCQDGLIRVYDTCAPEKPAVEYKAFTTDLPSASNPVKLMWVGESEPSSLIVAKRNGKVEKWDLRQGGAAGAAISVSLGVETITVQDIENNYAHGTVTCAVDSKVVLLNRGDLTTKKEYEMPKGMSFREEGGASMHPDGTKFIAGGSDLWLREFDCASGEVLRTFKGHHGPIRCVRYHPSGNFGASGSEDATIRIWELSTKQ